MFMVKQKLSRKFEENLKKQKKGVYPYEYMDDWEIFSETSLPEKKRF